MEGQNGPFFGLGVKGDIPTNPHARRSALRACKDSLRSPILIRNTLFQMEKQMMKN
jgi:hypothetical protein